MKKSLFRLLLVFVLAAITAVTLAACNPTSGGTGGGGNGDGELSDATFTVTFDSNGGLTDFSEYNLTGVKYGSLISPPTNKNGEEAKPSKTGYKFDYWQTSDDNEFHFDTDRVTSNLKLTAHYTPITYTHDITSFLTDGKWTYQSGHTVSVPEDGKFVTTFDSDSATIAIPTTTDENDYFVYWYYLDTVDGKEVEVPLTQWASKGATSVVLSGKYTVPRTLTLYPKFYSQLPDYTVYFKADELGETTSSGHVEIKQNDNVLLSKVPTVTRDGYDFCYWYYVVTSKNDDGEEVRSEVEFVFFDENAEDNKAATKVTKELVNEEHSTLTLYAKWVKRIEINSSTDMAALAAEINAAITSENPSVKETYQKAHIYVTEDVNLGTIAPLYSKENPFKGTLDGYDEATSSKHKITYIPAAGEYMGFIAANEGTISNVVFECNLTAADFSAVEANVVRVGGIAAYNAGTVDGCEVTFNVTDGALVLSDKSLYIGGVAAESAVGTTINNCTVNVNATFSADTVYAGGIIGKAVAPANKVASAVTSNKVTLDMTMTAARVYAGGLAGYADAVNFDANGVVVQKLNVAANGGTAYVGAFAGLAKWGKMSKCYADGKADVTNEIYVSANTVYAGVMLGHNETVLSDCRAAADMEISVASKAYVGGIAGYSTGTGGTRGNISSSHVTGKIKLTATGENAEVKAGGVVGQADTVSVSRAFVNVSITVSAPETAKCSLGFVAGVISANGKVEKSYFAKESSVTLNTATVGATDEDPAFDLTKVEGASAIESAKYADSSWILGEDNFDLDRDVWTVVTVDGKPELHLIAEHVQGDSEGGEEGGEQA